VSDLSLAVGYDRLNEQLQTRGKMFQGFVSVRLPGALKMLFDRLQLDPSENYRVDLLLIWPAAGGLAFPVPPISHADGRSDCIVVCECVLTDVDPLVPESVRLLWAIAASVRESICCRRQGDANQSPIESDIRKDLWQLAMEDALVIASELDLIGGWNPDQEVRAKASQLWLEPVQVLLG